MSQQMFGLHSAFRLASLTCSQGIACQARVQTLPTSPFLINRIAIQTINLTYSIKEMVQSVKNQSNTKGLLLPTISHSQQILLTMKPTEQNNYSM